MKSGQIVFFNDDERRIPFIILEITQKMYNNRRYFRRNGYSVGFYAYRGFWYGRNPLSIDSYGKCVDICDNDYTVIHEDVFCLKNSYLKTIL